MRFPMGIGRRCGDLPSGTKIVEEPIVFGRQLRELSASIRERQEKTEEWCRKLDAEVGTKSDPFPGAPELRHACKAILFEAVGVACKGLPSFVYWLVPTGQPLDEAARVLYRERAVTLSRVLGERYSLPAVVLENGRLLAVSFPEV